MKGRSCKTCVYYEHREDVPPNEPSTGECRRRSPTDPPAHPYLRWPLTHETAWCGEHEDEQVYELSRTYWVTLSK